MPAAAAEAAAAVRLQLPAVAAVGQPLQLVVAVERMAAVVEYKLPAAAAGRRLAAAHNQAAAAGRSKLAAAQLGQHSGLNQTPKSGS